jgi:hypothetical protein
MTDRLDSRSAPPIFTNTKRATPEWRHQHAITSRPENATLVVGD